MGGLCQSIGLTYDPEPLPTLWRRSGTALGRLRFSLKRTAARNALKKLARRHRSRLSDDARFSDVKSRLIDSVERFRADHPVVDHAGV